MLPVPGSANTDIDDAIRRYMEGELRLSKAAKAAHMSAGRFKQCLAERGMRVRTPSEGQALRHVRDADSEWKQRFTQASATTRERWVTSEANRERFRQLGREASVKNRGHVPSESALKLRSDSHQRGLLKVSPAAIRLNDWLLLRGAETTMEAASGRYNIDIAVGSVAVEVHPYSFNPLGPTRLRERQRTRYLCNRGWLVLYVWISARSYTLDEVTADYIVALAESAKRDPSLVGEYRVIRGTSELVATGRGDGDELS